MRPSNAIPLGQALEFVANTRLESFRTDQQRWLAQIYNRMKIWQHIWLVFSGVLGWREMDAKPSLGPQNVQHPSPPGLWPIIDVIYNSKIHNHLRGLTIARAMVTAARESSISAILFAKTVLPVGTAIIACQSAHSLNLKDEE